MGACVTWVVLAVRVDGIIIKRLVKELGIENNNNYAG
jgi:hypothetical protein